VESNWQWNVYDYGVGYSGVAKAARFLTAPPGFEYAMPLWLAEVRSPTELYWQWLELSNPDLALTEFLQGPALPRTARFPYGFDVTPD
jgi:hypothetical protein